MQYARVDLLIHVVCLCEASIVVALVHLQDLRSHSPMLAAMGSQLSHFRNCLRLKGAALPTLLPFPQSSLHPMPDWNGVQRPSPPASIQDKSERSSWLQNFSQDWMRHLCDCVSAQLHYVQSTFPLPFTGIIPKSLPKSTSCIHTSMSESATQEHGLKQPLLWGSIWSEIWKMTRNLPCIGPGRKQRQNPGSRRRTFEFQGKERKPISLFAQIHTPREERNQD